MPIYDQAYRKYEARGALRQLRFWPITREGLRLVLVKRWFLALLAVAWLPMVVRVVQIFIVTRYPEASRIAPVDGRLFGEFLNGQIAPLLLITIFGGSGLIAGDLRSGAILVYLSRPLTRRDYVLGKLGALLALNLSATLAPGLLLYLAGAAMAPELLLKWSLAWIGPAIVLHSFVLSLVMSLVALALSSLTKSARVAGLAMFALLVALFLVLLIVRLIYDAPSVFLLSLWNDLTLVGGALFGIARQGTEPHALGPALVLAATCLGSLAILRARVRAVEVVR
jgi:ABC-2 type transport system permease protein